MVDLNWNEEGDAVIPCIGCAYSVGQNHVTHPIRPTSGYSFGFFTSLEQYDEFDTRLLAQESKYFPVNFVTGFDTETHATAAAEKHFQNLLSTIKGD